MRERDPFGEALRGLRDRLRSGNLAPGQPLVVEDLAQAMELSATPVREALSFLAGQGLVMRRQGGGRGYLACPLSADSLAQLYRLHGALAAFAIGERPQRLGAAPIDRLDRGGDVLLRTEHLFERLVSLAGNGPQRRIQAHLADRLCLARRAEPLAFAGLEDELSALERLEELGAPMGAALRLYHRRRLAKAEQLATLANSVCMGEVFSEYI